VYDKDYNCLGGYSYLSKVNDRSTVRQQSSSQAYIRSKMKNLLRDFDGAFEVVVDYERA
jgi:hypothetical protein